MADSTVIRETFGTKASEVKIDDLPDQAIVDLATAGNLYALGVLKERITRL